MSQSDDTNGDGGEWDRPTAVRRREALLTARTNSTGAAGKRSTTGCKPDDDEFDRA